MTAMFRSELMTIYNISLRKEAAFDVLHYLGDMNCVQFLDMNSELQESQKSYGPEVRRCVEMERKLHYLQSVMIKEDMYIPDVKSNPTPMQPNDLPMYEKTISKWEHDTNEILREQTKMLKNYMLLNERCYVLDHCGPILDDAEIDKDSVLYRKEGQPSGDTRLTRKLFIVTGVVKRDKCLHFEMMLWRVSRGKLDYKQVEREAVFEDPRTGQVVRKIAFIAVVQGVKLHQRILKVCSGFRVNIYSCPNTLEERQETIRNMETKIADVNSILAKAEYKKCSTLAAIGRQWRTYDIQIKKAKAIYHTMNMFKVDSSGSLIGRCWIPKQDLAKVQEKLDYCSEVIGINDAASLTKAETQATPPTYNRTNKFTKGYQALIDAYGDPAYRELNPALYTLITIPFLFSLMFGDLGHGVILLVFACWMLIKERKILCSKSTRDRSDIWNILFGGRYVILMLALFSIYTGFMYNVVFSKPLMLMPPYWMNTVNGTALANETYFKIKRGAPTGPVYLFGMDPMTKLSDIQIPVESSLKMKLSLIVGVIHMLFGLILNLFNHIYFRNAQAIFFECIPQILFLLSIFMWLIVMIYYKWFKTTLENFSEAANCPPHLLLSLLDLILSFKYVYHHLDERCINIFVFIKLQRLSFCVTLLCILVFLFGTPLYKLNKNSKLRTEALKTLNNYRKQRQVNPERLKKLQAEVDKYSTTLGALMILQVIQTITYILTTIAHVASYLRLWALSFAHARLTEMAWTMILRRFALTDRTTPGAFKLVIIFAIWATLSVAILVVMEGLSVFGHALRLHWFEFMSQFYTDNGLIFRPFSFDNILCGDNEISDSCCIKKKKVIV